MSENRRDVRHPARVLVRFQRRSETLELLTQDVSFRGAFLRTDAPPALRQLVKLAFTLPSGVEVSGHAMVVHRVEPGSDVVPGAGVQFWGQLSDVRAWERFVQESAIKEKETKKAAPPDKVRRASERFRLQIDVVLDGRTAKTRDVSYTGLAVATDLAMPVGAKARLQLLANGSQPLAVLVVVRRRIEEPGFRGLGVEFIETTEEGRREVVAFVKANAAPDPDAVFVEPGDVRLL